MANLGDQFLKDHTLSLDYRSKKMLLTKTPLAIVAARINGQGPYRFAVDTGTSNLILLHALALR